MSLFWVQMFQIQVELLKCKHISYTRPGKGTWSCTHVKALGFRAFIRNEQRSLGSASHKAQPVQSGCAQGSGFAVP